MQSPMRINRRQQPLYGTVQRPIHAEMSDKSIHLHENTQTKSIRHAHTVWERKRAGARYTMRDWKHCENKRRLILCWPQQSRDVHKTAQLLIHHQYCLGYDYSVLCRSALPKHEQSKEKHHNIIQNVAVGSDLLLVENWYIPLIRRFLKEENEYDFQSS